jgi:glycosyltransferase involved in cell wall biosynthesis
LTTYRDSCPNFGAEALACGTPLILNKTNGLREYVNDTCGFVVDVDGCEPIQPASWTSPPFINKKELMQAFFSVYDGQNVPVLFPSQLDIHTVASKYISFFERVLA